MSILLNKGKNYIINGAMDYWQRGASFTSIANTYSADRFLYTKAGTAVQNITRDADVPTLAQSGFTFPYSLKSTVTTAQAVIAAGDFVELRHYVEGQFFAPLAGKTMTLSFWIKSSVTGIRSVAFRNAGATRSLIKKFTINAANTWEKKSVTFTHDTTGTWDYGTAVGLFISFPHAMGATYSTATSDIWINGNFAASTDTVNAVAAISSTMLITGIQLEEGQSTSNFERAGENVVNELQLCQRYYEKSFDVTVAPVNGVFAGRGSLINLNTTATRDVQATIYFKVLKRANPSVVTYLGSGGAGGISADGTSGQACVILGSNLVAGASTTYQWTADAEL
jgi:hypothetical protein